MSSTGYYSGLYRPFYEAAVLVDNVLLTLKTNAPINQNDIKKLGHLLVNLASENATDPSVQLLSLSLRTKPDQNTAAWLSAGNDLIALQPSDNTIRVLEELARVLEQEQVRSFARMRGHQL